jgi:hypothetical protein
MDDLDDLLSAKPLPPESPGLSEAVAFDAICVQRRRRWLIRGRCVGIVAVCYAAGLVSMWYWSPKQQPAPHEFVEGRWVPELPAVESSSADPFRNDPPEVIEKWAFLQTGKKRVELYRRAGDGYLVRHNVEAALRCYRKALDGGSTADLAIRADSDSWLLMSLKMARQKERPDARVN